MPLCHEHTMCPDAVALLHEYCLSPCSSSLPAARRCTCLSFAMAARTPIVLDDVKPQHTLQRRHTPEAPKVVYASPCSILVQQQLVIKHLSITCTQVPRYFQDAKWNLCKFILVPTMAADNLHILPTGLSGSMPISFISLRFLG